MSAVTPADREFRVLPRGDIRDRVILGNFRAGLRQLTNPDTGLPFSEEEIARATQPKTRFFIEADAIDSYGQGEQRRALYMADQAQVDRASTAWLENYHAKLWNKPKLPAAGGGGDVTVRGTPGTLVLGSTTIPDPTAYSARDPAGKTYQVLVGGTIDTAGYCIVKMVAIDTGADTNPQANTTLTWITRDPGMTAEAVVASDFRGGTPEETDAEQAKRILESLRYREGSGNDAQVRAWARAASSAIEDAFVYPCAFHSGSVLIAIVAKRGTTAGPVARLPDYATIQTAIQQLTPPGSPSFPSPPTVLVTGVVAAPSNLTLRVALRKGSASGWVDAVPFPSYSASSSPSVASVTSPTVFTMTSPGDAALPAVAGIQTEGGLPFLADLQAPHLMVWRMATSTFESLRVQKVKCTAPNTFEVTLLSGTSLTSGDWILPGCGAAAGIAAAVVDYMDRRGPGELVLDTDERWARCQRFPPTSQEWPTGIGADLAVEVITALGGSSSDAQLVAGSCEVARPALIGSGPQMLTLGKLGVFPP